MTQPATGTTASAGGYLDVDNRFQGSHRTGLIAVFFRDARGADTNISPHSDANGTINWSPFALDGKLRNDLRAFVRVNGTWVPNPDANEGWIQAGAFGEGNGPSSKPSIDTDDQMIEQSNWPFESDITKQDEPFTFQALQNLWPGIMRLRNNLPLSDANGNLLCETPGAANAGWSQVLDAEKIGRQFLLYGIRKREGKFLYEVDAYDFATLNNVGERKMGKKGTAAELTYKPEPSGYFMAAVDGEFRPIIKHTFVGGDAWASLGVPVPAVYTVALGAPSGRLHPVVPGQHHRADRVQRCGVGGEGGSGGARRRLRHRRLDRGRFGRRPLHGDDPGRRSERLGRRSDRRHLLGEPRVGPVDAGGVRVGLTRTPPVSAHLSARNHLSPKGISPCRRTTKRSIRSSRSKLPSRPPSTSDSWAASPTTSATARRGRCPTPS